MPHSTDSTRDSRYEPPSSRADDLPGPVPVRVEHIELERAPQAGGVAVVRSCVFLGELLPPDARVDLLYDGPATAPACTTSERMWSARSYENGWFLYEAHVPDTEIAVARNLRVRIRPADLGLHADVVRTHRAMPSIEVRLETDPGRTSARHGVGETPGAVRQSPEADHRDRV